MGQIGPSGKMLNGAVVGKWASNIRNEERYRSLQNMLNGQTCILLEIMNGTVSL